MLDKPEKGWSIERFDWDLLPPQLLDNKQWGRVALDPQRAYSIPETPGVYVICVGTPDRPHALKHVDGDLFGKLYNAIYVGMSGDLRDRFKTHSGPRPPSQISTARKCFNFIDFWYHRAESETIAEQFESILQRVLGPSGIKRFETIEMIPTTRKPAFV